MRRLLALVLTLAAAAPAEAQRPTLLVTPPPTDLTLEQALQLAVPASEAVGIARVNVKRADGEVKRAMADLLPQPVYEANVQGVLTYVNRSAMEQFGFGADDLATGLHILQMIDWKDMKWPRLGPSGHETGTFLWQRCV